MRFATAAEQLVRVSQFVRLLPEAKQSEKSKSRESQNCGACLDSGRSVNGLENFFALCRKLFSLSPPHSLGRHERRARTGGREKERMLQGLFVRVFARV